MPDKKPSLPNLPAVTALGAYEKEALNKYLRKCMAKEIPTRRVAKHLGVPAHRVDFYIGKLAALPVTPRVRKQPKSHITVQLTPEELLDYNVLTTAGGYTKRQALALVFKRNDP